MSRWLLVSCSCRCSAGVLGVRVPGCEARGHAQRLPPLAPVGLHLQWEVGVTHRAPHTMTGRAGQHLEEGHTNSQFCSHQAG